MGLGSGIEGDGEDGDGLFGLMQSRLGGVILFSGEGEDEMEYTYV